MTELNHKKISEEYKALSDADKLKFIKRLKSVTKKLDRVLSKATLVSPETKNIILEEFYRLKNNLELL